jgi:zinc/manganese transport system substrate-binding protein
MIMRIILILTAAAILGGCGGGRPVGGTLHVVASTNVYGDIARQIGGAGVDVTAVLSDPNADPHLFEPGTRVGLNVSHADVVVQNGVGYDAFMLRLESAAPSNRRIVVTVADALDVRGTDANPHLWYDVPRLPRIAAAIAGALARADPKHSSGYRQRERQFDASLRPLDQAVAGMRKHFARDAVAYTEPVPGYLLAAAGLRNVAPSAFTRAIEDGTEPPPGAVAEMIHLVSARIAKVLLYNSQAVSPITSRVRSAARAAGVPVVGVSETLPPRVTFQAWQLAQVEALDAALSR